MLPIKKHTPPRGLQNAKRHNQTLTYKILSENEQYKEVFKELRESLLKEQGYVCCYCQKRIIFKNENDVIKMRVEHFIPKAGNEGDKSLQLEYTNLLACCLGNSDSETEEKHCDASKSGKRLKYIPNPTSVKQTNFDAFIHYHVRENMGHVLISPVADKQAIKDDIEKILNLNEQKLRVQRYSVWKAIWNKSTKFGKAEPNIRIVHEIINEYSKKHNNQYQPYRGFVIQWFSNRFKKELLAIKKG